MDNAVSSDIEELCLNYRKKWILVNLYLVTEVWWGILKQVIIEGLCRELARDLRGLGKKLLLKVGRKLRA